MCIGHYSQGISRVDLSLVYDQRGDLEGGTADEYDCASWTTVLTAAAPFIFLAVGVARHIYDSALPFFCQCLPRDSLCWHVLFFSLSMFTISDACVMELEC
jgi:hypothetical protein